ncbi:chloride channel protein CLC-e-like [Chenopodium quinoa]|uniref:chloride channel protein CLC-e-like n=1 Tax=Chenopodium quinoa TaxID=63459 RepID=UPI000B797661|nr:chloride channel protein CLC-e-like [Chenopodium quinoa]
MAASPFTTPTLFSGKNGNTKICQFLSHHLCTMPLPTSTYPLPPIINYATLRRRHRRRIQRYNFNGLGDDNYSTTTSSGVAGDGETLTTPDTNTKKGILAAAIEALPLPQGEANTAIISACVVGLLTGVSVVLFNYVVHELRDFCWDGVPYRGASWLREENLEETWKRTVFIPVSGGVIVAVLNYIREGLDSTEGGGFKTIPQIRAVFQQFLKSLAACVTLGTGNSLGPEGPCVEIGSSIGKGIASLSGRSAGKKVPLVAAGSAAGIASGFNAAVAGCFFAVESVIRPSPDSDVSLTNTTSMIILSAVIASVLSEVGLGSEPAFKVPVYDFRSASELPLYLLLGILCGLVSLALTRCTTFMLNKAEEIKKAGQVPKVIFPVTGGLAVGLMALAYPEILYRGFQNVDILLESRPFVKGLSADLLAQLVGVKIIATSFCRASGLVGGYYAPSLFIGAATGMAYGKFIALAVSEISPIHLSFIEVASPQAYGLVAMAATLAGVCQVPLTSVLLLFELTQDYRIILPLLAAVGTSSWITSSRIKRTDLRDAKIVNKSSLKIKESNASNDNASLRSSGKSYPVKEFNTDNICEIESSSCFDDSDAETEEVERKIFVSQAMRTSFATVLRSTSLIEAVTLMLAEKQSCALIVDDYNYLIGVLSLEDILVISKSAQANGRKSEEILVADTCSHDGEKDEVLWTATPDMDLLSAEIIMIRHGLSQLPVISEVGEGCRGKPVGIIDMQCIELACRAVAAKEYLNKNFRISRN